MLKPGQSMTAYIKVRNSGNSPEAFFVDPRLCRTGPPTTWRRRRIRARPNRSRSPNIPQYLVPTRTAAIAGAAQTNGSAPLQADMGFINGDPDVESDGTGTSITMEYSSPWVSPGIWSIVPTEVGPYASAGTPESVDTAMEAEIQAFDTTVKPSTGDLWLESVDPEATFNTITVDPGQHRTIPVTITAPKKAGTYSGRLYVDDAQLFDLFGAPVPNANEVGGGVLHLHREVTDRSTVAEPGSPSRPGLCASSGRKTAVALFRYSRSAARTSAPHWLTTDGWHVADVTRLSLDADGSSAQLLERFVAAAAAANAPRGVTWGVAMPDPFDYERGVGMFEGVGKFAALRGGDVGAALRSRLGAEVTFLNDADAFTLGEWVAGAAQGARRCAGLTLGTGIGSGWLIDGRVVDPGTPPGGRMHRMNVGGQPLEDVVSRRAIRRDYALAGGDPAADVREIADSARAGAQPARRVLDAALASLGRVVGRCVAGFRPDVLVVGGSMSASWDLFAPAFRAGALGNALPPIKVTARADDAALVGAALHAQRVAAVQ